MLRRLAQELLPDKEPWIVNEALIELGATVCQRNPRCTECPLKLSCQAYQKGLATSLPVNSKKTKIEHLHRAVAVVNCDSSYLVSRGERGAIMSDLYEFPYFDISEGEFSPTRVKKKVEANLLLDVVHKITLDEVTHSFTRYHVRLYPILFHCQEMKEIEGFSWLTQSALQKLAFSSGHRRIFQQLSS